MSAKTLKNDPLLPRHIHQTRQKETDTELCRSLCIAILLFLSSIPIAFALVRFLRNSNSETLLTTTTSILYTTGIPNTTSKTTPSPLASSCKKGVIGYSDSANGTCLHDGATKSDPFEEFQKLSIL